MAEINNINSIAREIVTNLDKQDGKEDGKIEASIWNKFVCEKQGNEIHNYINTNSAVKSVIAYLKREVAKTGQAIEEVANEWLKNVGGGDKTKIDERGKEKSDNDLTMKPIIFNDDDTEFGYKWLPAAEEKTVDEKQKQLLQKCADNAAELLMDVATGNYRYKVEVIGQWEDGMEFGTQAGGKGIAGFKEPCQKRVVRLKDGREITVYLQKQDNEKWKIAALYIDNYKDDFVNHIASTQQRIFNIPENIRYIVEIEPLDKSGNSDFDNMFAATKENDTESILSLFKLAQKIFGDDIEV